MREGCCRLTVSVARLVVSKQNRWLCCLRAWPTVKVAASIVGEWHMLSVRQVAKALQNLGWRQDAMIDAQLAQAAETHELAVAVGKTKTKLSLGGAKLLLSRHRRIIGTCRLAGGQDSFDGCHRVKSPSASKRPSQYGFA